MYRLWWELVHYAERLSPQRWLLVMAAMVIVGAYFLRGFGSRSRY
jgi:hypothetical protein